MTTTPSLPERTTEPENFLNEQGTYESRPVEAPDRAMLSKMALTRLPLLLALLAAGVVPLVVVLAALLRAAELHEASQAVLRRRSAWFDL